MSDHNKCAFRKHIKYKIINGSGFYEKYEQQKQQISNIIKYTITNGESNSALIIGPRGSGKTALLQQVLKELRSSIKLDSNAIVIELNGFIHTDDKLALESCTQQMNLENVVGQRYFGSFAENLIFLLDSLKSGNRETSKCLVFVLEEFDLFCNHNNQTLLYNLLDMTQGSETCVCVIGITCRLDVIELFEKRVKSRFSHRQIYLFPGANIKDDEDLIKERLDRIQKTLSIADDEKITGINSVTRNTWNKHIHSLLQNQRFINAVDRFNQLCNCERVLNNILLTMVSELNATNYCKLLVKRFEELVREYEKDDKVQIINSLSVLEICLLIAMKHHCEIYDAKPFNFEMIFERYTKFANSNTLIQRVQRYVVFKAFEHLKNLELVLPVSSSHGNHKKEYVLYNLVLQSSQIEEAFNVRSTAVPTEVRQWLKSVTI